MPESAKLFTICKTGMRLLFIRPLQMIPKEERILIHMTELCVSCVERVDGVDGAGNDIIVVDNAPLSVRNGSCLTKMNKRL